MDSKTALVSPYLLRPLRSLAEAEAERKRLAALRRAAIELASVARRPDGRGLPWRDATREIR